MSSSLDIKRLVEQPACRSRFCRLVYKVDRATGERINLSCKSWRCPRCRSGWGRKWSYVISEQLSATPCTLLVNLTTAEMIDNTELAAALRFFIRRFREVYGDTEYVKVVEYNQRKTQPHFHLLFVCKTLNIPPKPKNYPKNLSYPRSIFEVLRYLWCEALSYSSPTAAATTVVWCDVPGGKGEKAASYAVGYVTGKKGGGKDEEPDETWKGRKLTYSKKFFMIKASDLWERFLDRLFPNRHMVKDAMFCLDRDRLALESPAKWYDFNLRYYEQLVKFLNRGGAVSRETFALIPVLSIGNGQIDLTFHNIRATKVEEFMRLVI